MTWSQKDIKESSDSILARQASAACILSEFGPDALRAANADMDSECAGSPGQLRHHRERDFMARRLEQLRAAKPRRYVVAFVGGGCDGEFLARDGWSVTRDRAQARTFQTRPEAESFMAQGGRLLGLNRPERSVSIEAE